MQILLLTNDNADCFEALSEKYSALLGYAGALDRNVLLTSYDSLYVDKLYIYARECFVLRIKEIHPDVLLSPSIVIDVSESGNTVLSDYLTRHWLNTHQACYRMPLRSIPLVEAGQHSTCMAFAASLLEPDFVCMAHSLSLFGGHPEGESSNAVIGQLEQALNEYFANHQFYKMAGIHHQDKTLRNLSSVFSVTFDLISMHADYGLEIKDVHCMHISEYAHDSTALYIYLDALLDYRLNTYVKMVKFREFIIALCQEHQVDFEPSYFRTFVLRKGERIGLHRGFFAGVNDPRGNSLIRDKHATNVFLSQRNIKVNRSREYLLSQLDDPIIIESLGLSYPLVLKPKDKKMGYGVVTNILNPHGMLNSIRSLKALGDIEPVLIEEFFQGITYRILVVGNEVIAVLKFMPTYIIGNGTNTILELIRSKNKVIRSRIRINDALELSLANDGYTWDTVLAEGHRYVLSHNSHASMGGQATNVTDVFSEEYKELALRVCNMLLLKHAGIDININEAGDYRILEVNSAPALSTHLHPKYGTSIDTYSKVFENLFDHTDLSRADNSYLPTMIAYHQ